MFASKWLDSVVQMIHQGRTSTRRRSAKRAVAARKTDALAAQVERFESRDCPSVTSLFDAGTATLTVTGSGAESVTISSNSSGKVTVNGVVGATLADRLNNRIKPIGNKHGQHYSWMWLWKNSRLPRTKSHSMQDML